MSQLSQSALLKEVVVSPAMPSMYSAQHVYSGVCHGTLGELFQGPLLRGGEVLISLISLPVKKYSAVHYVKKDDGQQRAYRAYDAYDSYASDQSLEPYGPHKSHTSHASHASYRAYESPDLTVLNKEKSQRAIARYLDLYQKKLPAGQWIYDSELLESKGMASSTADIVATIRCLDALFSHETSSEWVAMILRDIERSDSVFLNSYALYLSEKQEVVRSFTCHPQFYVCYIDEGEAINTEALRQALVEHYTARIGAYLPLLNETEAAFMAQDFKQIAECSTRSALLAQDVLPKKNLEPMLACKTHFKADGIVVAHTGSLIGYLFINKPDSAAMGRLSSFFHKLGYSCRFIQTGL